MKKKTTEGNCVSAGKSRCEELYCVDLKSIEAQQQFKKGNRRGMAELTFLSLFGEDEGGVFWDKSKSDQ